MNRERFLVKSFGDNIDGTKAGLIKLIQLLDTHDHAVIVVPEIGKVKSTMLVDALGEDLSKALIKNREIAFPGNKKISLCAQSTLKNYRHADAYLALWGSEYTIADIEALPNWASLVLVTWLPKDSAQWEAANRVTVIYDDKKG
ncbi:hypothetical protein SAMN05880558_104191 [Aeromonas sp. RU39B]|uniref:hypothetical protein n=1 Tax=Aeromonas sp. RU39B TaxID=1907416 RepID=UPI0009556E76|nr:hypothetical protein [Aeromonas sp. RU39B]SIQ61719.1 hypothetical protein SAMN05880558_104191 [Aeromonas sp. RU39B]